jgi:oligopeptide/dipeptide ABC transporter ATP-binding protein
MSGGMLQRVMIAMALACRPSLLIADEPTTALDVTIQLQILDLLRNLQRETGMSVLFITHDLGVVAETADYAYVMYAGRIVEHAGVDDLFASPLHPYTQGLMRCMPTLTERKERLEVIPGAVPDPADMPGGCRFHPRCELSARRARDPERATSIVESSIGDAVLKRCVDLYDDEPSGAPPLREVAPGHFVACWETGLSSRV